MLRYQRGVGVASSLTQACSGSDASGDFRLTCGLAAGTGSRINRSSRGFGFRYRISDYSPPKNGTVTKDTKTCQNLPKRRYGTLQYSSASGGRTEAAPRVHLKPSQGGSNSSSSCVGASRGGNEESRVKFTHTQFFKWLPWLTHR